MATRTSSRAQWGMPLVLIMVAVFVVLVLLIALPGALRRRRIGADYGGGDRSLRDTVNVEREKARGWNRLDHEDSNRPML